MKKRLMASLLFGLIAFIICAVGFNFAHNPVWFENSARNGIVASLCFFVGAVLDKSL